MKNGPSYGTVTAYGNGTTVTVSVSAIGGTTGHVFPPNFSYASGPATTNGFMITGVDSPNKSDICAVYGRPKHKPQQGGQRVRYKSVEDPG